MKNKNKKFISLIAAASMAMAAMPAMAAPTVKLSGSGKDVAVSIADAGTQFYAAQIALTVGENTYTLTTAGDALGVLKTGEGEPLPLTLYIDSLDLREGVGDIKLGDIKSGADIDFSQISGAAQVTLVNRSLRPVEFEAGVVVPKALDLTASLGWDGENFTIDFVYDGEARGDAIRVYSEDGEDGEYVEAALSEGVDGAAFSTVNTNRQYQAKGVSQGVESLNATAPVSVYSLVMDAVAGLSEDTRIKKEQLDKVNEVLKNGGLFIDKDGNLTAEAQKVMTKEGDKLTLTPQAVTAGLAFSAGTGVKDESETKYNVLVINPDGTATLSVNAELALAETVSLEAVNLEFVPTDIDETSAGGSDADFGLVPEL